MMTSPTQSNRPSASSAVDPQAGPPVVSGPLLRTTRHGSRTGDGMKKEKITFVISICVAVILTLALPAVFVPPAASAQFAGGQRMPPFGFITANPTISIATGSATSSYHSTTGVTSAHVQWVFGTVTGTYTGCTMQAKTSYDGANWLTLGSAAALTVTTGTLTAWDIYQQAPSATSVTVTTPSSSAAMGFGAYTEYVFACSAYGTSAPVTATVIYK